MTKLLIIGAYGQIARVATQLFSVNGSRRSNGWRLRMAQDYEWRDGRWIALNCVTSLW